ncbi:hypothetical protein L593_09165 [Salinarchaeum sp. Harcht-Bsk1]|uniref:hypothetical protein n=1 Tax=Salinarchaeum sp. Harcht-Bsk1 TaxID=1333523 RepID=UPI0003423054|nr:hypothetical protein [Salinarchaeum sp. Harcht-Bsk1]AGN01778.1 hypothetical protein L593_09165 [Salinarchaeum sp. Harcht-Bsk1]
MHTGDRSGATTPVGPRGSNWGRQYRLVSELRRPGERLSIPDRAENVSVDVLSTQMVRVTYLSPLYEVSFEDDAEEDSGADPRYFG